jgi:hypothetical protein
MQKYREAPLAFILAYVLWGSVACSTGSPGGPSADHLRTPQGLIEWQQGETTVKGDMRSAFDRYGREKSIEALQGYEKAVRTYVNHGFSLYRAYKAGHLEPPPDLVPSLEQRTTLLMDVAEEYIKQGGLAMGEGIAAEVVHDYSDLPEMAPAQRRAEALLLHYRYRQDY